MEHSPFADVFTPGARFARVTGEPVEMSLQVVGELKVPTGRLCAADPLTASFDDGLGGFARQAPTGVFPVEAAVARFGTDRRVACARVRFGAPDAPAVRWEPAVYEGQAPATDDDLPAYGVDTGMGCFFDTAARAPTDEATSNVWLAALDRNEVTTWTWHVAEAGAANIVMFSSGGGDGLYTSYWGVDAEGRLAELVTDFGILKEALEEHVELPLPLPPGVVRHPFLEQHGLELLNETPLLSRPRLFVSGKGFPRLSLSDGSPIERKVLQEVHRERPYYVWKKPAPDTRLRLSLIVAVKRLARL